MVPLCVPSDCSLTKLPQHTSCSSDILESDCGGSPGGARGPGGYSLTWFIHVRAAEQGMFFGLAVLNRV